MTGLGACRHVNYYRRQEILSSTLGRFAICSRWTGRTGQSGESGVRPGGSHLHLYDVAAQRGSCVPALAEHWQIQGAHFSLLLQVPSFSSVRHARTQPSTWRVRISEPRPALSLAHHHYAGPGKSRPQPTQMRLVWLHPQGSVSRWGVRASCMQPEIRVDLKPT